MMSVRSQFVDTISTVLAVILRVLIGIMVIPIFLLFFPILFFLILHDIGSQLLQLLSMLGDMNARR